MTGLRELECAYKKPGHLHQRVNRAISRRPRAHPCALRWPGDGSGPPSTSAISSSRTGARPLASSCKHLHELPLPGRCESPETAPLVRQAREVALQFPLWRERRGATSRRTSRFGPRSRGTRCSPCPPRHPRRGCEPQECQHGLGEVTGAPVIQTADARAGRGFPDGRDLVRYQPAVGASRSVWKRRSQWNSSRRSCRPVRRAGRNLCVRCIRRPAGR